MTAMTQSHGALDIFHMLLQIEIEIHGYCISDYTVGFTELYNKLFELTINLKPKNAGIWTLTQ